jgi:hypothetical protein
MFGLATPKKLGTAVVGLSLAAVALVHAAPVDPSAPLPAGHPVVGAPAAGATPTAARPRDGAHANSREENPVSAGAPGAASGAGSSPPPVDPDAPLPPGHPGVGAAATQDDDDGDENESDDGAMPAGHPTPDAAPQVRDQSVRAPDLRPGTIEVHLRDPAEQPLKRYAVRLGIMKQDVAEGDSHTEKDATTDDDGVVVFSGLETGSAYSYRVTATRDAGTFASEPIRLEPTNGQKVLLHVFSVTRDLKQALVGMRGVTYVAAREDVFQVEVNFQILNIGKQAWVPDHLRLSLPPGAKAFRAADSMKDARMEKLASGELELLGTYAPGEHEVGFQFQLANDHTRTKAFRMALLPHVAEMRVIAERARGMSLHVEGFPDAEGVEGRDGSRLLLTGKHLARGDAPLETIDVSLDGLPVPSTGRWYAVGIALAIAVGGLFEAGRKRPGGKPLALPETERREAEDLVLDELVALERLRQADRIGPQTYKEMRSDLLDALSRLNAA